MRLCDDVIVRHFVATPMAYIPHWRNFSPTTFLTLRASANVPRKGVMALRNA